MVVKLSVEVLSRGADAPAWSWCDRSRTMNNTAPAAMSPSAAAASAARLRGCRDLCAGGRMACCVVGSATVGDARTVAGAGGVTGRRGDGNDGLLGALAQPTIAQPALSVQQSSWCRPWQRAQTTIGAPSLIGKRQYGHERPASTGPAVTSWPSGLTWPGGRGCA
jgi:hypothetical protein